LEDIECLEFKLPTEEKLIQFSDYADNVWDKIEYNHIQICTFKKRVLSGNRPKISVVGHTDSLSPT